MLNDEKLNQNELSDDALDQVSGGALISEDELLGYLKQLKQQQGMTAEFAAGNIESNDFWWNLAKGSVLVGGVEEEGDRAAVASFIRNNWDNNKLVPKKSGEGTKYQVDLKNGSIVVRDPSDIADLKGVTYMKTRHNGQTYLWKQTFEGKDVINYTRVKPLGNNAEYLEMSLENIMNPLSETAQTLEDMDTAELQTPSPAETDAAETSTSEVITDNERAKAVAELADLLMKQNPRFNKTEALNKIEEMKKNPKLYVKFLQNVFKQKGLNLNEEDTLNEFKKLC